MINLGSLADLFLESNLLEPQLLEATDVHADCRICDG